MACRPRSSPYHEHNERERSADLVRRMAEGAVVALCSDAGMPLVSDPGLRPRAGVRGRGAPGGGPPRPERGLSALVASALPADAWRFVGFLPRKRGALEAVLEAEETVVAFESPRRVGATLAVLAERDPGRPVALCRELTKVHEEIVRGSAAELAARYTEEDPRGEVVLVIGGAPPGAARTAEAVAAVRRLVDAGAKRRVAAGVVADLTGGSANELYRAVETPWAEERRPGRASETSAGAPSADPPGPRSRSRASRKRRLGPADGVGEPGCRGWRSPRRGARVLDPDLDRARGPRCGFGPHAVLDPASIGSAVRDRIGPGRSRPRAPVHEPREPRRPGPEPKRLP
jgi:16S rRNA (cytidine1402-2'-O)-methyltransferase